MVYERIENDGKSVNYVAVRKSIIQYREAEKKEKLMEQQIKEEEEKAEREAEERRLKEEEEKRIKMFE